MIDILKANKFAAIVGLVGVVLVGIGTTQLLVPQSNNNTDIKIKRVSEDNKVDININKDIKENKNNTQKGATESIQIKLITVDVSGAVTTPGLYQVETETRVGQIVDKAGGLSKKADQIWVGRNLNLATKLHDGDKVYIPYQGEVKKNPLTTENTQPSVTAVQTPVAEVAGVTIAVPGLQTTTTNTPTPSQSDGKISINAASASELEELPGVGKVTAQKIIDNRPYNTLEEIKEKKSVNKGVYEKIKEKIKL